MKAKSAISVTLYDMSGAPLHPSAAAELERAAERLAQTYKLTLNVEQG